MTAPDLFDRPDTNERGARVVAVGGGFGGHGSALEEMEIVMPTACWRSETWAEMHFTKLHVVVPACIGTT
jgi:hypothetical protein